MKPISIPVDAEENRLIFANELDEVEAIYWQAPLGYLGNRLTSYGARLQLLLSWVVMRGDTSGKPTTGPNVILFGKNGLKIAFGDESLEGLLVSLNVTLTEEGWYHVPPTVKDIKTRLRRTEGGDYHGESVTRSQFLSVLVSLDAILIRAAPYTICLGTGPFRHTKILWARTQAKALSVHLIKTRSTAKKEEQYPQTGSDLKLKTLFLHMP